MNYNYHTHTARCGHASGTERRYIENALAAGVTEIGFSEHAPLRFPDGHESGYRLPMALTRDYMDTLSALREEYRGRANILIGFEMEYYPLYFKDMLAFVKELGAEYLIIGQHFIDNEAMPQHATYTPSDSERSLNEYVNCIIDGIKTGVFTYIAHPDVFSFTGEGAVYDREMTRLCEAAKELDVPLEINFLGIRTNRRYPNDRFWEIAGKIGTPVTFGLDAHDELGAADVASLPRAMELIHKYNLNYIGAPKIVPLQ